MMMKSCEENEEQKKPLMDQSEKGEKTKRNFKILAFEIWAKFLNPIIYLCFTVVYFLYYCWIDI